MTTKIMDQGGVAVLRMGASYSAFNDEVIEDAESSMLAAIDGANPPRLVLDFSLTEYFSSMFIEVLFRVWNRVRKDGGRFAICELQPVCREILSTTKLDTVWSVLPTVEEAVAECSA